MIQQICLTTSRARNLPDFDEPLELVMNPKDRGRFKKIIELLFDKESVQRIMKERRAS